MLNLVVLREDVVELGHSGVCGMCTDSGSGRVYVIYEDSQVQCLREGGSEIVWEGFLQADCGLPINCTFLIDSEAVCVSTAGGAILLNKADEGLLEEVGEVEGGIVAAEWSPDGEILVLLSGEMTMMVMTKDWNVLQELDFASHLDLSMEESSSLKFDVAWRGDAQYFATSVCTSNTGHLIIWERSSLAVHAQTKYPSCTGAIAWQPNGRHLYASSFNDKGPCIALFEKNGLEHGDFSLRTSGKVSSMNWSLDCQLLGIVIEDPAHKEQHWKLQVWRRNNWHWYLKYESWWSLDSGEVNICWDDENELRLHAVTGKGLYILYEFSLDVCVSARGSAAVVDGNQLKITSFRHSVVPPPLAMVCIQFPSPIKLVSFLENEDKEGVLVSLSSGSLGLTLCSQEDHWEDLETNIEWSSDGHVSAAILSEEFQPKQLNDIPMLHLQGPDTEDVTCCGGLTYATGETVAGAHLSDVESSLHNIMWASMSEIVAVTRPTGSKAYKILQLQLMHSKDGWEVKHTNQSSDMLGIVLRCVSISGYVITAMHDGCIIYHSKTGAPEASLVSFPEPCQRIFTTLSLPKIKSTDFPGVIGLSGSGALYFGADLISTGVTSAGIRCEGPGGPFLLFTTKSNELHIMQLKKLSYLGEAVSAKADQGNHVPGIIVGKTILRTGPTRNMHAAMRPAASVTNRHCLDIRPVEQGSKIVSVLKGGTMVVLQMPRGNLETIHPRLLVLCGIADCLNKEMYNEAWDLATCNRVDLNILVDYKWPAFLNEAEAFVTSMDRQEDICDLVMALKPGSVLDENGLYQSAPLPSPSSPPIVPAEDLEGGKIASICKSLRKAITNTHKMSYLRAIATTYARSDPPDLEAALKCIKSVREEELESINPVSTERQDVAEIASPALKHLMLYVDTNTLYDVALGMYDLEMAYMVVTNAQMDPAEYLMELQRFASLQPMHYQRYSIDMHLRRFSTALGNLVKAGDNHFEGCLDLAKQKGLLHELLALVEDGDEGGGGGVRRISVLCTYGEWLSEQNMHEDAAVAFMAAKEFRKAFASYKKGCSWGMCLSLAGKLGMSEDETRDCAMDLLEELKSSQRLEEAAKVALDYLDDADEAVLLLSEARCWREAVRVAYRCDREDLIETVIAPAAAECASTSLTSFKEDTERVSKYWARLKEVRSRRHAMESVVGDTGGTATHGNAVEGDMVGVDDGGSTVAGMSVYTERTYANATLSTASISALTTGGKKPQKRRKKNKGLRIRQGTPEEERALCEHIKNLLPTNQTCEEIGQLLELLILLSHERDAHTLQHALDALIKQQKEADADIRNNPPPDSSPTQVSSQHVARWKFDILRGTSSVD